MCFYSVCSALCLQAAERLGVCEAALKRICRRNHIKKWPYRHLQSIRRRMADLEGQENPVPTNGSSRREQATDSLRRCMQKKKRSGKREDQRRRATFLLPHENERAPRDYGELGEASDMRKNARLKILEEERQRVISLAHIASKATIPGERPKNEETAFSETRFGAVVSFGELLAWSIPQHDTAGASSSGALCGHSQSHKAIAAGESALLLLADVCSLEERLLQPCVPRSTREAIHRHCQPRTTDSLPACRLDI